MSDAWMKWHLIQWKTEMGEGNIVAVNSGDLEKEIERLLPSLNEHFSKKWSGAHHTDRCKAKGKMFYMQIIIKQ